MTTSKRTSLYYWAFLELFFFFVFVISMSIIAIKGMQKWGLEFNIITITVLLLIFFFMRFLVILYRNTKKVYSDKENKMIVFKDIFFGVEKKYPFSELDGYVTGRFIEKNRSLVKLVWIVKENRMIERINENYVSNINDLEVEIKELKYLGYQHISFWKRIKMLFRYLYID